MRRPSRAVSRATVIVAIMPSENGRKLERDMRNGPAQTLRRDVASSRRDPDVE